MVSSSQNKKHFAQLHKKQNIFLLVQKSLSHLNCQVRAEDLEFLSKHRKKTKSQAISKRRQLNILGLIHVDF
jgi:hypothetical protein